MGGPKGSPDTPPPVPFTKAISRDEMQACPSGVEGWAPLPGGDLPPRGSAWHRRAPDGPARHAGPGRVAEPPRVPERKAGEGCVAWLPAHRAGRAGAGSRMSRGAAEGHAAHRPTPAPPATAEQVEAPARSSPGRRGGNAEDLGGEMRPAPSSTTRTGVWGGRTTKRTVRPPQGPCGGRRPHSFGY